MVLFQQLRIFQSTGSCMSCPSPACQIPPSGCGRGRPRALCRVGSGVWGLARPRDSEHAASYPCREALYCLRDHVLQKHALTVWPKSKEQTRWHLKGQPSCSSCFHTQTFVLDLPGVFLPGVALSMWLKWWQRQPSCEQKKCLSDTKKSCFTSSP